MSDNPHPKSPKSPGGKVLVGCRGPWPINKWMQTLLQQAAAMSLITTHNQHSLPPNSSLSQRVLEKPSARVWGGVLG